MEFFQLESVAERRNENETFDLTNDVIAYIEGKYDEIGKEKGYDKILIAFNEIEKQGIRALYERMWKQFPYCANSKTAASTDASERKIRYITNN